MKLWKKDKEKSDKLDPAKNPLYHKYSDSKWRRVFIIAVILILLAGAAGAGYWFFLRERLNSPAKTANPTQQDLPPASSKITRTIEHYDSQNFALGFDHPQDWTVADVAGSGQLMVTSPDIQLTDSSGQKVTGQIVMSIRNKQQKLPEFDSGNALAARQSEKIDYSKPTSTQRGSTHISFLRYMNSAGSSLDGIYITGDTGYTKDQAVPKADFVPVDPIINIIFKGDGTPLTVSASSWDNPDFSQPLRSMLQSLAIN